LAQAVLVLDVGKTHSKLTLASLEGRPQVRRVRANTPVVVDGRPSLDVDRIEAWIIDAITHLAAEARIVAIAPVGHGAAAALVAGDRLAAPVLDYEATPPASGYDAERDPFARTLSPRLPAGLNLGAQLDWQEALYPSVFGGKARIVPWAQYWAFRLSGVLASEVTSLGCHTDLWFPAERGYSDLARRRGWDEKFAPLRAAGEVLGTVRADIADATGLSRDCKVLCGLHDSNASLCGARALPEVAGGPFCLVSTGTWFVAMQSGATALPRLDEGRDTLGNVDVAGHVVPSARFMGGREYAAIAGDDLAVAGSPAEASALIGRGVTTRPSFVPGCGPYPGQEGAIIGDAETPGERAALASLHLALMARSCLALIGAEGPVVIEGRFAGDPVFAAALAALWPGAPLFCLPGGDGVALGAARLWSPLLGHRVPAVRAPPLAADINAYARRWCEGAAQKRKAS
jgi:sugar (pentulose or hexulose) kinase